MPTTVATPGDIAKLQRQIDALGVRVAALEAPVVVPPPVESPPPPPPPPEPPPTDLLPVAGLTVPLAGRVRVGVAVAPGVAKALGRVRVGDIEAQADNPVFDRDGWLRWFLLSAILPAGTHRIAISPTAQTSAPVPSPSPQAAIAGIGQATRIADWRRGPVVTESIWRAPVGSDGLAVQICESLWADGKSGRTIVYENGRSVPGQVAARTLTYDGVTHVPYTRWLRREGEQPVFAEVIPLAGGTVAGHLKATRALQNFASDLTWPLDAIAALPETPFAVTDAEMIGYAKRKQGQPGGDAEIGQYPAFMLAWLTHYSPATAAAIRKQADVRQGGPYFLRMADTGVFPRPNTGTDWWYGDLTKRAADDTAPANQSWTESHWPSWWRIPYLLWGEFCDLEGQIAMVSLGWLNCFTAPGGSQMTRHALYWPDRSPWWVGHTNTYIGDQGMKQLRTIGWQVRTTVQALASLPGDDTRVRALLGWDKSTLAALWDNACIRAHKIVADATGPAGEPFTQGWGIQDPVPHKFFDADGVAFPPGFFGYKHWMWCYVLTSMAHGIEMGEVSAEGIAWWKRQMATPVQVMGLDDPDKATAIAIDYWPKIDGAKMNPDGSIGIREGTSGQPIRTAGQLLANIRDGGFIGSQEADWQGNYYALASYSVNHGLPGAEKARAFALQHWAVKPNHNHYIEPRVSQ